MTENSSQFQSRQNPPQVPVVVTTENIAEFLKSASKNYLGLGAGPHFAGSAACPDRKYPIVRGSIK